MMRIKQIIAILLVLFCLYKAAMSFCITSDGGGYVGNFATAFFAVMQAVFWGFCAAFVFVSIFMSDMVRNMVDSLLAPRRYLDRRPPVVSPAIGNMERGDLTTAQKQLDALLEEMPESPYLCNVRFKFFLDFCKNELAAMDEIERYFSRPDRIAAGENAPLLLRYSELAVANGKIELCKAMISRELKLFRRCYCKRDRELLQNRLMALAAEK